MTRTYLMSVIGGLVASAVAMPAALASDNVIIATFGDPTPAQMAAHDGKYAAATGWNVEWRKFKSGTDVIAAMASGDVSVAELGSSPLAIAATQGVNLEVFMIDYVIGKSRIADRARRLRDQVACRPEGQACRRSDRFDVALLADGGAEARRHRRA